ncbi:MAG: restriction endonuclease subunit S [Sporomusaceae bacterium]|nr:restriction endonuclease subunit S [Sporomusaceae bacterium]
MSIDRENWTNMRLGDVVHQIKDQVDAFSCGLEYYLGGEHFNTDDLHVNSRGKIARSTIGPAFIMRFKPGDVLLVSRNPHLRKMAVVDFEGICSNVTYVLRAETDLMLQEYLPFVVRSRDFWNFAIQNKRGSTNFYLNWSDFEKYTFKLPPLEEQKRIAELLWAADNSLVTYRKVLLDGQDCFKIALDEIFKSLGNSPMVPFSSVGEWKSGGTPSRKVMEYWNGNIPWVSPKDMKIDFIRDSIEKITDKAVSDNVAGAKLIPKGALLIVVRGMILAHTFPVAITGMPVAINQDMKAILVSSDFDVRYVFYWLKYQSSHIVSITEESSHGTKRLALEVLGALSIPKVPIKKQQSLVNKINIIAAAIEQSANHVAQAKSLLTNLCNTFVGGASDV